MSLDPGNLGRSSSPASSEASHARASNQTNEDGLKKDKNYRRYASNVDRALSLFDTALQEWADYISFLSRLLKALQSHPPALSVVPNKAIVAKRLAQCLNPSLPSGVHQKALEVYGYIFSMLKPAGLARDLPLYLPGIAPTLTFASLSVRPLFLSLVETYILDLDPASLRPALKALILALLPGLEEETSEDFDTVLGIVDRLREKSEGSPGGNAGQYFWQCLFLASITNPTRRMGVLAYLNRHLPKLGGKNPWSTVFEDSADAHLADLSVAMDSITSPEPGLLIRCFTTGLADEQQLVQRNFLDLLVTHLPLHSPVLQKRISKDDLRLLITAAIGVVTRRDMSLNRRLWAWLLGPDTSNGTQEIEDGDTRFLTAGPAADAAFDNENSRSKYFAHFGASILIQSIHDMIQNESLMPSERSKPFRISLSLMDRWEVGGLVVPEIFLPAMRSVHKYKRVSPSKGHFEEVFRSASAFFDGVESNLIFSELLTLVRLGQAGSTVSASFVEDLKLANFLVSHFNLKEEEMLIVHIPLLILALLLKMRTICSMAEDKSDYANLRQVALDEISAIINKLFSLVPGRAFGRGVNGAPENARDEVNSEHDLSRIILDFYAKSRESLESLQAPLSPTEMGEALISEAHSIALLALESEVQLKERLNLLLSFVDKIPGTHIFRDGKFFGAMSRKLRVAKTTSRTLPFSIIAPISSAIATLFSAQGRNFYISYEQVCDIIPCLVQQLWEYLSPLSLKFHVEAVRCLWILHAISWQDHLVEACIASLMVDSSPSSASHVTTRDQADRFFVLWTHSHQVNIDFSLFRSTAPQRANRREVREAREIYQSSLLERPLLIVLDQLSLGSSTTALIVKEWLQDPPSVQKILRVITSKLGGVRSGSRQTSDATSDLRVAAATTDTNQCYYLFRTIDKILICLDHVGWTALTSNTRADSENQAATNVPDGSSEDTSFQGVIVQTALDLLTREDSSSVGAKPEAERMKLQVLAVLKQLLSGPGALKLLPLNLDAFLMEQLTLTFDTNQESLQFALMEALLPALKARLAHEASQFSTSVSKNPRKLSMDALSHLSRLSFNAEKSDNEHVPPPSPVLNPQLLQCILKGLTSRSSRGIIDKWINFLSECLPLYSGSIFQILLSLVECFCKEISTAYKELQQMFEAADEAAKERSEHVTVTLLTGLENCIAIAHDRLLLEEANVPVNKTPEQPQSFFGNMVSGVFSTEGAQPRSMTGNNRLSVLLCFQDAVRLCYSIWTWGNHERSKASVDADSMASFQYTSLRMRNRSRRMLEHLFTAEPLECLETLVQLWRDSLTSGDPSDSRLIFNLLHTLDSSRPKITTPAIFNAIYSRTNPAALDPNRMSTMMSQISETELASFLVTYARSLEDDALEEIWGDCTTFLRDVLANPFPHRQILVRLLEFAAILGEKMENTNFGDDRRARKDLGDLLLRILTAIFTSKSFGLSQEPSSIDNGSSAAFNSQQILISDDIFSILLSVLPSLTTTLGESDRIGSAMSGISLNVISPLFHSRLFPQNVSRSALDLIQQMSKIPSATKYWRKDVGEAFNDPKFFASKPSLVKSNWLPLLRHWVLADKERMADLLSRLTPPTSAGIMFGVGASAARLEADRKTQLNLRRIALLILAADGDHFSAELAALQQKLEDLLTATNVSSPSSATRAEIYMVLRSIVLKTSTIHLAPFWPLINTELHDAISAVAPGQQSEIYNPYSLLQACKLLETLLVTSPDDFQLQEWLFVTDTIDIIYPPDRWESIALADRVSRALGARVTESTSQAYESNDREDGSKRSWLTSDLTRETAKDEIVDKLLRPFFDRLSIHTFESTYSLAAPDLEACKDDLLADLFNEFTMASSLRLGP
ncbi:hypothetical protein VTO42DRAFT_7104 [Malbranchea cinnamomea]